ncbi:MTCH2 protein, partial [Tricholaema leucomelas]|nr:MTCH2 protein [Tricholaema leucomelas]
VLLGSGLTVLSQPLMYVKVLVQVGYEPLPPTLGRNIFGRQIYQLPGLFAYAKHIVKVDGRAGLFKGLTPRLCSSAIGTIVHSKVLQGGGDGARGAFWGCRSLPDASFTFQPGVSKKEPVSSLEQVLKETSREMVARSAATLITHPFHVITLRCMVQFIGRETKYSGTLSAFTTIYREEGILGFFAGLIPRLLGDILSLWLCNMLAYLINTYALENGVRALCPAFGATWRAGGGTEIVVRDRKSSGDSARVEVSGSKVLFVLLQVSTVSEMKSYSQAVTGFFASMLTYPFVLVSNLMAVNNCGLAGGLLPYAPTYTSWLDCWSQLHREGNMSRGNSLFFRKVPTGKRYVWE